MACAICKKAGGTTTIRQSWIDAGGYGSIPEAAIVHPACDAGEQRAIQNRYILISRWNPMSQVHGVVYCLTTERRSCTGLEHIPPSEELLAMKIFIECAEEEFVSGRI